MQAADDRAGKPRLSLNAALRNPLVRRAIFVASVVLFILLGLQVSLLIGWVNPALWGLLQAPLLEGAKNTFVFTAIIIPLGTGLGFLLGWARISRSPILRWPVMVYIDIVRGTPILVMILVAFFAVPLLLKSRDTYAAGLYFALIALAIHTSAYQAEIFRAGFQSIPRAQVEAAESIGLSSWQAMRFVVLPQTFRIILPALGNEFAVIIKDTSLLSAIGATELVFLGRTQANEALYTFGRVEWVFTIWLIIALLYFVITYVINQVTAAIEHHYRVPGLGSVAF